MKKKAVVTIEILDVPETTSIEKIRQLVRGALPGVNIPHVVIKEDRSK